jgi:acetyltransferase
VVAGVSEAYPSRLESVAATHDGTIIELRPIRPDDEPLLHDLAAHMSREDLRMRFFSPIRTLPHALAERLVHLDYTREMALAALHDGTVLGIARYSAEPGSRVADYAVAVRSDWTGHGIGYLLMARLIEIARREGIAELIGEVLGENHRMVEMCRDLGFTVRHDPSDATLLEVRKSLAAPP